MQILNFQQCLLKMVTVFFTKNYSKWWPLFKNSCPPEVGLWMKARPGFLRAPHPRRGAPAVASGGAPQRRGTICPRGRRGSHLLDQRACRNRRNRCHAWLPTRHVHVLFDNVSARPGPPGRRCRAPQRLCITLGGRGRRFPFVRRHGLATGPTRGSAT